MVETGALSDGCGGCERVSLLQDPSSAVEEVSLGQVSHLGSLRRLLNDELCWGSRRCFWLWEIRS